MKVLLDDEITDEVLFVCSIGSALVLDTGRDPQVWVKQGQTDWHYTSPAKFVSVVSTIALKSFRSQRCALFSAY